MTDITWQPTDPALTVATTDDLMATWGIYSLRVEQLSPGHWWWMVDRDGERVDDWSDQPTTVGSKRAAMVVAEIVARTWARGCEELAGRLTREAR